MVPYATVSAMAARVEATGAKTRVIIDACQSGGVVDHLVAEDARDVDGAPTAVDNDVPTQS
jgi:hypothetical protein